MTVVATEADGLNNPKDVEFNPFKDDDAWVCSKDDSSMLIISDASTSPRFDKNVGAPSSTHFMAKPSGLAFGKDGFLATVHEEDQLTQGNATPEDFMGPTLWTSKKNQFDGGHGSHYDMLHNTPNGAGIAWEKNNVYWLFDGYHNSLTRYNFKSDHGPGGADHSDGDIRRFAEGEVSYVPETVSHMWYDAETDLLYVADTGNARIAVLDTKSGTSGNPIGPNYDNVSQNVYDGAVIDTFIEGSEFGITAPSGLEYFEGRLYVADADSGVIHAFNLDGERLDYLETGRTDGSLGGLAFSPLGDLWFVDSGANELVRIQAK